MRSSFHGHAFRAATSAAAVLVTLAAAAPASASAAEQHAKTGCCEAYISWFGATGELQTLPDRSFLKKSVPPDWFAAPYTQRYFLPSRKNVHLQTTLSVGSTSRPSRIRYRWDIHCFLPAEYVKATAWTWVNIRGAVNHDPASLPVPVKTLYGARPTDNCTSGSMAFQFDQGDSAYGEASLFLFKNGRNHNAPRTLKVWKWVTSAQAKSIKKTKKFPMPKGAAYGQYFITDRAYADKVAKQFRGYRLAQGTLSGSDLLFYFNENKKSDTGIVGAFFRKKLSQPKGTFKIVK